MHTIDMYNQLTSFKQVFFIYNTKATLDLSVNVMYIYIYIYYILIVYIISIN
jgi:hypothetical protein